MLGVRSLGGPETIFSDILNFHGTLAFLGVHHDSAGQGLTLFQADSSSILKTSSEPQSPRGIAIGDTVHVLWGQKDQESSSHIDTIYYAQFVNGRWISPRVVYQAARIYWSSVLSSSVVNTEDGQVHVAFSAAPASQRTTVIHLHRIRGRGFTSQALDLQHFTSVTYVDLESDGKSTLYLAYIAPAEEVLRRVGDRDATSVHFVLSDDSGRSWSEQIVVSISGEQHASEPDLVISDNLDIHLLWAKNLSGGYVPEAIWHVESSDEGRTWTAPDTLRTPYNLYGLEAIEDQCGDIRLAFHAYDDKDNPGLYLGQRLMGRWNAVERLYDHGLAPILYSDRDRLYVVWHQHEMDRNTISPNLTTMELVAGD